MNTRCAKLFLPLVALFAMHTSKLSAAVGPTSNNFFTPQSYVADGGNGYTIYYLTYFNYYTYAGSTPEYVYKFNFGFLAYLGPTGGDLSTDEAYFYDFNTRDYFYTSGSLYPYFYSFNQQTFLYYFENSNPREFYNFKTSSFIFY